MKVIYIGNNSGTSQQRINAFKRLGHEVVVIDPEKLSPVPLSVLYKWTFEMGGFLLSDYISWKVKKVLNNVQGDIAWVNNGDLTTKSLIKWLKKRFGRVVNYNNDLPFGDRDKKRWQQYKSSVPYYDLLLVRSNTDMQKPLDLGAKKVAAMYMLADEVIHKPHSITDDIRKKWASDVLFVGTWFPERGGFVEELIRRNVPLTIYGDRWQKAPEWETIKPFWKGGSLHGFDYSHAIQSAKICLGLVSEENNDLHTRRSIEVPYSGTLLCAKKTYEHELMYKDKEEIYLWNDTEECADLCHFLLKHNDQRIQVASAGKARCIHNDLFNESFISGVLKYSESL